MYDATDDAVIECSQNRKTAVFNKMRPLTLFAVQGVMDVWLVCFCIQSILTAGVTNLGGLLLENRCKYVPYPSCYMAITPDCRGPCFSIEQY